MGTLPVVISDLFSLFRIMKRLHDYNQYIGKTVKATSANDYSEIKGKYLNVRECVSDYTKGAYGIQYLADIEIERAGYVKVGVASTMEIIEANASRLASADPETPNP